MRERISLVGGSLSIISTPGEGTRIAAKIPLGNASEKNKEAR